MARFARTVILGGAGVLVATLLVPDVAAACQVCFGNPDAPMAKGVTWGVWFMLAVVFAVEGAIGFFFFSYLRKRARYYPDGQLKPALKLVKE